MYLSIFLYVLPLRGFQTGILEYQVLYSGIPSAQGVSCSKVRKIWRNEFVQC